MKKTIAIFLTVLLALTMGMSAFAEGTSGRRDSLVVANATKLSGYFFTELWGNNTSDQDVRARSGNRYVDGGAPVRHQQYGCGIR